jgi:solute:Na+ symporter, SSS family
MQTNLLVLLVFAATMVAIGFISSRKVGSSEDFFVAGRRLGTPLIAFSLFATWFGAETCLGVSGAVYRHGLSGARADPLGYGLCLVLLGLVLARRLVERRLLTLGDLYRQAYGPLLEKMLVFVLVPSSILWGAAQIKAMGQVLAHLVQLDLAFATVLAAAITIGYTLFGGLWGDVLSDFVQGCIVMVGLGALLLFIASHVDLGEVWQNIPPERLELGLSRESWFEQLDRWAVPILGSLVTQEALARVLAARSPEVARRGAFGAAGLYLTVGSIPVVLGLLGPILQPGLGDPERLLPELGARYLPPTAAAVFDSALLAAMLSTVDSVLLASAALVSHNVLGPLLSSQSDRLQLLLGRVVLVLSGCACTFLALGQRSIYALVEEASQFGTAGVVVTAVAALFHKRPSPQGAGLALVVGVLAPRLLEALGVSATFLISLFSSLVAYSAVASAARVRPRNSAEL